VIWKLRNPRVASPLMGTVGEMVGPARVAAAQAA
jgi:hypothetical protein